MNKLSNEYLLHQILEDQKLDSNQIENLKNQRDAIVGELVEEIGGNPIRYDGGSYAKGTMIRASYDLDIVLYWPTNFQYSPKNLYIEVGGVLQSKGRNPQSKKVGWEIPFPGNFHIDVIPGKIILNKKNYAYLFNTDTEGRFQTSVKKQVNYVKRSGRQDVIKLMKLWKIRKDVPIKTFILENMIIEGCKDISHSKIEPQLIGAFEYVNEEILIKKIHDPSNINNIISNDITDEEKHRIKILAEEAINAQYWREVFS